MPRSSFTRWHLAGAVRRWVPDIRGRDRLLTAVQGPRPPAGLVEGETTVRFGPGLHATVPIAADGSFVDVFFAAYEDPALVPVLKAVLAPGACFVDVGANIGLYSLWASRLVGPSGTVLAFEPVPATRAWLELLVAENGDAVEVLPMAVSDRAGSVFIETVATASGRSHIVDTAAGADADLDSATGTGVPMETALADSSNAPGGTTTVEVTTITLDDATRDRPWPTLVKIDVEGHELSVFRGMVTMLAEARPAVVFECPDTVGAHGDTAAILDLLADHGYQTWSLTSAGLQPTASAPISHNVLALHPARHEAVRARLDGVRFRRNQNC